MKDKVKVESNKARKVIFQNEQDGFYPYTDFYVIYGEQSIISFQINVESNDIHAKLMVFPTKNIINLHFSYTYDDETNIITNLTVRGMLIVSELNEWLKIWKSHLDKFYSKARGERHGVFLKDDEIKVANVMIRRLLQSIIIARDNGLVQDIVAEINAIIDEKPLNVLKVL